MLTTPFLQVGLVEMHSMVTTTGGNLVLDDSFTRGAFQGSLRRLFAVDPDDNNDLIMAFNAETQVICSKEIKVQGASGHLTSLNRKSTSVAETTVGVGGTCAWRLGGIDHTATAAFFFDLTNTATAPPAAGAPQGPQQCYVQIATKYRHSSGRLHLRVTTVAKPLQQLDTPAGHAAIRVAFDQVRRCIA